MNDGMNRNKSLTDSCGSSAGSDCCRCVRSIHRQGRSSAYTLGCRSAPKPLFTHQQTQYYAYIM